jgi:hypothetical protein
MSFDLFGPATKCDIRVGYISTDRGFVDNVGLYDANHYAKLNPGTQFLYLEIGKKYNILILMMLINYNQMLCFLKLTLEQMVVVEVLLV